MSVELIVILMFGSFFVLMLLGVPIAWAMLAIGIGFGYPSMGPAVFSLILDRIWDVSGNFSLIAIPLFVFMATLLRISGVVEDLYEATYRWLGPLRGGLAIATVVACTILSAMVGTAGAGITIMGLVALPEMLKRGYDKGLALGTISASGTLGVLIPPSIMFVLYGLIAGQSIGDLFMGGVVPGLLFAGLYIAYIAVRSFWDPAFAPGYTRGNETLADNLLLTRSLIFPCLLVLLVLGSIYAGVATVSEAAGFGAAGAMIAALMRRRLRRENLSMALVETFNTLGAIMWVGFGAFAFNGVFTILGGGNVIRDMVLSLPFGPYGVVISIMVILIVVGTALDEVGIIFITVPIFVPIIKQLGVDPLWFAILFNLTLQIAYLSPPYGLALFYLQGVAPKDITTEDLWRSTVPFMILQVIGIALVFLFPQLAVWLPRLMQD